MIPLEYSYLKIITYFVDISTQCATGLNWIFEIEVFSELTILFYFFYCIEGDLGYSVIKKRVIAMSALVHARVECDFVIIKVELCLIM